MNPDRAVSAGQRDEAWLRFVLEHRHPLNVAVHLLSVGLFWGALPLALWLHSPLWLVLWLGSGFVGSLGHLLAREGRPDPWPQPRLVRFATRLGWRVLTRQYAEDVRRAELEEVRHG